MRAADREGAGSPGPTPRPSEPPDGPRRGGQRDWRSAVLLLSIGAVVAWAATGYPLGTLRQIGPGFFPFSLGLLLVLLGGLILLEPTARPSEDAEPPFDARAFVLITGGIVAFLALGRLAGLVPASFVLVLLAALADRRTAPGVALALAAALTGFAALVFKGLLGIAMPLVGRGF